MTNATPVSYDKKPLYQGSVQTLHNATSEQNALVSCMSNAGSVFDVGTIFSIKGNDISRTALRHLIFTKLANANSWQSLYTQTPNKQPYYAVLAQLTKSGAKTHHLGMLDKMGCLQQADILASSSANWSNKVLIKKYLAIKPQIATVGATNFYDYSTQHNNSNRMIALEYIVRLGLVKSSSLLKHYSSLADNAKTQYLQQLNLTELKVGTKFSSPLVEFTSKYESVDRRLSLQEASLIASIDKDLFTNSIALAQLGALLVQDIFAQLGLTLWDLKWEFAKEDNRIVFADTLDTDSVRVSMPVAYEGNAYNIHFNKQAIRDYYQICHLDWYKQIMAAQIQAKKQAITIGEVLAGVKKHGTYLPTPTIDADFMQLQENKVQLINEFIENIANCNDAVKQDLQRQTAKIAQAEFAYYKQSLYFARFLELARAN